MKSDIKMEDFQRKAFLVVGSHMAHAPYVITYSSVVTMYIALTMATLHDVEVKVANLLNAYVMRSNREYV